MSDFEWIDPFAEIARARAFAASEFKRGQQSVLGPIQRQGEALFARRLEDACDRLARHVAAPPIRLRAIEWPDQGVSEFRLSAGDDHFAFRVDRS